MHEEQILVSFNMTHLPRDCAVLLGDRQELTVESSHGDIHQSFMEGSLVFQEKDEFQQQHIHGLLSVKTKEKTFSLVNFHLNSKVVNNLI